MCIRDRYGKTHRDTMEEEPRHTQRPQMVDAIGYSEATAPEEENELDVFQRLKEVRDQIREQTRPFVKATATESGKDEHYTRLRELKARKKELQRQLPPRPSYQSFSRATREDGKEKNRKAKMEIKQLLSQIKLVPRGADADRAALRTRVTELRSGIRDNKDTTRAVIAQVRDELKSMRRAQKLGESVPSAGVTDPWKERLSNAHNLFPGHSQTERDRICAEVELALQESPDALVALIDSEMRRSAPLAFVIDFNILDALVYAVAQPQNFTALVRAILEDERRLLKTVSKSYHHDLFDKTVLLQGKELPWKLRMHWFKPAHFTLSQEEMHSHRNHFASHILHGGFTHRLWEPCVDSEPVDGEKVIEAHRYIYDPLVTEDGTAVFHIDKVGTTHMKLVDEASVTAEQTYYMHPSVIHEVTALRGNTVTCVLNSPQVSERSCFATVEPWEEELFERARFTQEEMTRQLREVLELSRTEDAETPSLHRAPSLEEALRGASRSKE
eukprot:TRINITY_DN16295_c0_g1_i5.p1 TRINITY_DN16295_c0_g1~~TRINITY_DN16295_c0_g1_i5.p1  ORF type:complete len:501 (+),score=134.18 TRINITY_DN16295_c0_g1_i5:118-1620(+)